MTYQVCLIVVMLGVFTAIPILVKRSRRYGKREVLAWTCLVEGLLFAVSFCIPPPAMLSPLPVHKDLLVLIAAGLKFSPPTPNTMRLTMFNEFLTKFP